MASPNKKPLFLVASALLLAACNQGSTVLPSLSADSTRFMTTGEGGPPALGNTYFEPQGVTPGRNTETFVGNRVVTYRAELTGMQEAIRTQNTQLQALRNKTIQDSNGYHENVASMRSKLQLGTTPANPILMNRWEVAQAQLNTLNQDLLLMDQLGQLIVVNQSSVSYLLNTIRSSYAIPGAVDEDHRQLRILEDETQQTAVLIDRLLAELRSDIARQTAYVNSERANLTALAASIQNGQLFGQVGADGYAVSGGATSGRGRQGLPGRPVSMQPGGFSGSAVPTVGVPLVTVRFDRPNISFDGALERAVQDTLSRNPNASFSVVAVQAGTSGEATRGANQALRVIARQGVPPARVTMSSASQPGGVDEVRVFGR